MMSYWPRGISLRCLLLFLHIFLFHSLYTQNLSLRTYDSNHGLIRSMVISVYQDSEGFLWIGTSDGLSRFNGVEFHNYTTADGLINNYISDITEDRDGQLWIATARGLSKYRDGTFTNFTVDDGLASNMVLSVLNIGDDVWIGTGRGLNRYSLSKKTIDSANNDYGLSGKMIRALHLDSRGRFWAGSHEGPYIHSGEIFKRFLPEVEKLSVQIHDIAEDGHGNIWIASLGDGLIVIGEDDVHAYYDTGNELPNNRIIGIAPDRSGNIWAGTFGSGIIRFTSDGDMHVITKENGLPSMTVYDIIEDAEGNIWFATQRGLTQFRTPAIVNYTSGHGLISDMVTSIAQDREGRMWFGTYGRGISILNEGEFTSVTMKDGLPFDVIRALYTSENGDIWIATHRGVSRYTDGILTNYDEDDGLAYHVVLSILEDSRGRIWFGTYGKGVSVFENGTFTTYSHEDGIGSNVVHGIAEDRDGALWFATDCGVSRKDGSSSRYYHVEDGLPSDTVRSILIDDSNGLWFCTDRGVALYNDGTITSYNQKDGLSDDRCRFITIDDDTILWIGTNRGISSFDGESFQNFNTKTGLHSNEMNTNAVYNDRDGNLWLGTAHGVMRISPGDLHESSPPLPVYITDVRIENREIPVSNPVELQHNENNIQISFVGLNLSSPEMTQYRYKLLGVDSDWRTTSSGTVTFPSLPHGEYTFAVKAKNNQGVISSEPATITFSITTPYWLSWWFLTMLSIAIIGIAFAVHRYRLSKVLELERLRTRIASDLHDDVGSTLTKISLYSELVHDEEDRKLMQTRAKKIGGMTRDVISTLSDVVWSIDARNDNWENLINRMKEFAHTTLSAGNIKVSFSTSGLKKQKRVPVHVRQNIFLIFKEAINNIAKHSEATEVDINLSANDKAIDLTIRDNGRGLHDHPDHKGHGLRNMTMRAKQLKGELTIVNNNGTTVILKSPQS